MRAIRWSRQSRDYLTKSVRSPTKRRAILDCVELAAGFPEVYAVARSERYQGLRAITTVPPFVLLYRFNEELLVVVALFHGRMGL